MALGPSEIYDIFNQTVVVRRPTYGIVSGYHELPYVCIGSTKATSTSTTRVTGKVHVSPRIVIRPSQYEPSYGEIFGGENVDVAIAGRIFGFFGFHGKPVECKSEHLEVKHLDSSVDVVLSEILDDLDRREDITTGVIVTPNAQYYPVSIERFISSVLEDEFRP